MDESNRLSWNLDEDLAECDGAELAGLAGQLLSNAVRRVVTDEDVSRLDTGTLIGLSNALSRLAIAKALNGGNALDVSIRGGMLGVERI